jgi:hypothetical protein
MSDKPAEKSSGSKPPSDTRTMEQRIADLELANAQLRAGTAGGNIPLHGAGPYEEVAETWSQGDQEAALRGEFD